MQPSPLGERINVNAYEDEKVPNDDNSLVLVGSEGPVSSSMYNILEFSRLSQPVLKSSKALQSTESLQDLIKANSNSKEATHADLSEVKDIAIKFHTDGRSLKKSAMIKNFKSNRKKSSIWQLTNKYRIFQASNKTSGQI